MGGSVCLGGGQIVINNGELVGINNGTGHYKTGRVGLYVMAKILEAKFPKAVNFGTGHTEDDDGEIHSKGAKSYIIDSLTCDKNLMYRMERKDQKSGLTGFEREGNEMVTKYYTTLPKSRSTSICEGIEEYAKNPNPALLRTIIKLNNDDINKIDEKTGKTPLEFAIHSKCPEEVSAMLLLNGAKTTENITKSSNRISDLINRYESLKQVRQFVGTTATSTSISQTSHSANKSSPRQF